MKPISISLAIAFSLLVMACSKKQDGTSELNKFDCGPLFTALVEDDDDTVDGIMDVICADYAPNVTDDDEFGHRANLDAIIVQLKAECPEVNASFGCYACLESFPPQSLILFSVDSAGVAVERYARLLTIPDAPMRSNL